jgi:hypothetical protein
MTTPAEQKIEISVPQGFHLLYWGVLIFGALFILIGWGSANGIGYMIVGCFLGIVSRIIQAEHHHRTAVKSETRPLVMAGSAT